MKKILLIEDDLFLRELYTDLLKGERYSVETAAEGKTGLDKILENKWDLVLLDLMLPEIDGAEIIKRITKNENFLLQCPLVLLTNIEPDAEIQETFKKADGYLTKSELNPEEFIQQVKKYLLTK